MAFVPRLDNCAYCGGEYHRHSSRHKYCSEDCKEKAKYGARRTCANCGTILTAKQPKYCSANCKYEHVKSSNTNKRTCETCEKEFKPTTKTQRFCSVECKNRGIANYQTFTCEHCGKVFEKKNCKGRKYRFCSHECAGKAGMGKEKPAVGTRNVRSDGYVYVQTEDGCKLEHRHVMEQTLGRTLAEKENVHHKNGDRADNRPENLELWSGKGQPQGQRPIDIVIDTLPKLSDEEHMQIVNIILQRSDEVKQQLIKALQ